MDFSNKIENKIAYTMQFLAACLVIFCGIPTFFNLEIIKNDHSFFSYWKIMHFNTSIGLLAFGSSLLLLLYKKERLARPLAVFFFSIGFLTFLQYILKVDYGIDELFRAAHYNVLNEHPGRMALASSICFSISGFVVFVLSSTNKMKYFSLLAGLLSSIPTGIGLITLMSYSLETVTSYNTGILSHMAIPTAVAFLIGGTCLLFISFKAFLYNRHEDYKMGSIIFASTLFLGFLGVGQFLINEEQKHLHGLILLKTNNVREELKAKITETTLAVERLASRTSYLGTKDKAYLSMDSKAYIDHIKIIGRVGLIDKKFNVIWSYPPQISYQVKDFNQGTDNYRKKALENALKTSYPALSHSIELKSGGKGFLLPVALTNKKDPAQFIYVTIKLDRLFQNLTSLASHHYQIGIYEEGQSIYQSGQFSESPKDFAKMTTLSLGSDTKWEIIVTPTKSFLKDQRSSAPYIVLFGGTIISMLVGFFLYFVSLAKRREEKYNEEQRVLTKQLNLALSTSHMAIWSLDLETGETWRSENHDKMFGYKESQSNWTRDSYMSHMNEFECEKFKKSLEQTVVNGLLPHKADFKIQRCDDLSVRYIAMVTQHQVDEITKSERIIGFIRDVTDERLEENERFIEAERSNAILNSVHHLVITTDKHGTIQTYNPAAEKMLGYTKEEAVGKMNPGAFHDHDEVVKKASALSLELGQIITPGFATFTTKTTITNKRDENEWTFVRKDGSRFPVILSVSALRDLHGEVVGYLGVAADLTEHKKNQEQLRMTYDRLERVVEASEEGIWERDYVTKEILFMDDQTKKIMGIPKGRPVVYQEILDRIHPADKAILAKAVENHVKGRTSRFHIEFRIDPTGDQKNWKWVRARGKVENNNGVLGRLVSTISDVTNEVERRKQLEEALQAASEAALVKSAFLASMSHEIRTPLNGIIGMTDLLLESNLNEDQKRFAEIVQNSGVGLLDLINDILDFSKIESGKLELENTDFSLSALVENQTDLLMARARKKNITLTTYIDPRLPQTLRGDSGRIGQVLLNLIGNAVKFTQMGGVSIRVTPILGLQKNGKQMKVRFEIIDTGIGIDSENVHKLFQPFSQADNKISRKFGGTGLGLSISKQIIEAMKGEIGVDSTLEKGSTFWFEISLHVTNHADFFAKHPLVNDLQNVRILLVDEDPLAVDVVKRYISSWNMKEITACSIGEAKAMATQDNFDIVMIYLKNSDSPALNLTNAIKELLGTKSPRFIAITEFDFKFSDEEATKQGFFESIRKPLKQSLMFDAISRAISGEKRVFATENATYPTLDTKSVRILIADDVKTNRLVAVSMLESLGYSAYAVSSGKEAIEALDQMHFDIILMDCLMPEMDGIEATRHIRESSNPKIKHIPIIALTANVNTVDRDICIDAGMNAFLGKPFLKDDMNDTLECILTARMMDNESQEKGKILLVDDNEENRTLVLHYLKDLPYDIDIAVDGLDALEKFKKSHYTIVLMDMQMPVMDGYEATKAIRDWEIQEARNRTIICALTANAMKEECDRAFAMGCDDHLSKPIRKQKLLDYINKKMEEKKAQPICLIAS